MLIRLLLALALAAAALPAAADIIATYQDRSAKGGTVTVTTNSAGLARLDMGEGAYVLVKGTDAYTVTPNQDGSISVMRMADMARALEELFGADLRALFGPAKLTPRAGIKSRKTGARTVAGVPGDIYQLTGLDSQNPSKALDITFSPDPKLRPIADAYQRFADSGALMMAAIFGPKAAREMIADNRFVFSHGAPLEAPGRMQLTNLREAPVDPAHYSLPTAPMSVAQIKIELQKGLR